MTHGRPARRRDARSRADRRPARPRRRHVARPRSTGSRRSANCGYDGRGRRGVGLSRPWRTKFSPASTANDLKVFRSPVPAANVAPQSQGFTTFAILREDTTMTAKRWTIGAALCATLARRPGARRRQHGDRRPDPADDRPVGLDRQAGEGRRRALHPAARRLRSPAKRSCSRSRTTPAPPTSPSASPRNWSPTTTPMP